MSVFSSLDQSVGRTQPSHTFSGSLPVAATYTVRVPSSSFTANAILAPDGLITGNRCKTDELATMDSVRVTRSRFQILVRPDWLEKNAIWRAFFSRDGNPRSPGSSVIRWEVPVGLPRFKSKGS